eukprot:scaffold24082_cov22-Prasinocladus_malaysianus.AAC.1
MVYNAAGDGNHTALTTNRSDVHEFRRSQARSTANSSGWPKYYVMVMSSSQRRTGDVTQYAIPVFTSALGLPT